MCQVIQCVEAINCTLKSLKSTQMIMNIEEHKKQAKNAIFI